MEQPPLKTRTQFERIKDEKYGLRKWHCDDILADKSLPDCVLRYLEVARTPFEEQIDKVPPPLYATYKTKRVRVVMASRFGDVGITEMLNNAHGHAMRVYLPELTDFSDTP